MIWFNTNFPTHMQGHILDFLISPSSFSGLGCVRDAGCISDHFAVSTSIDFDVAPKYREDCVSFRQYHKIDNVKLSQDLECCEFVRSPASTAEGLYGQYNTCLSSLLDRYAPLKTKILKKPSPSWITDIYRVAKKVRRQYERLWRRNKTPLNRSRLRQQTSLCNNILRKEKANFYTDVVNKNAHDPKKLWMELNGILHCKSK